MIYSTLATGCLPVLQPLLLPALPPARTLHNLSLQSGTIRGNCSRNLLVSAIPSVRYVLTRFALPFPFPRSWRRTGIRLLLLWCGFGPSVNIFKILVWGP